MVCGGKGTGENLGSAENTTLGFRKVFPSKDKNLIGRILLLEDDALTGEWIASSLAKKGIEVHWCQDLESALEIFKSGKSASFHAVLTDVYLAENQKGGLDLLKIAQEAGLPVAVISSRPDLPIVMEALNQGASLFLQKPFEIDEVFQKITALWEQPKHLPSFLERFMEQNRLTDKEKDVCRLLFKGLSNKEIATVLTVTEKTIKFHVTGIFEKCGVQSRSELASTVFPV